MRTPRRSRVIGRTVIYRKPSAIASVAWDQRHLKVRFIARASHAESVLSKRCGIWIEKLAMQRGLKLDKSFNGGECVTDRRIVSELCPSNLQYDEPSLDV